jgi:hypothetical protein
LPIGLLALQDDSVSATFVDAGAGQFFIDEMSKEKEEEDLRDRPIKRAKYVAKNLPGNSQSSISGGALGPGRNECFLCFAEIFCKSFLY